MTDPIRAALDAAGCTREDAEKIAAFVRNLAPAQALVSVGAGATTLEALAAALDAAAARMKEAAR